MEHPSLGINVDPKPSAAGSPLSSSMTAVLVLLMLFGALAQAADLRFSSSLWGFQAFQERTEVWAREHGHRLIPYEVGRMTRQTR